MQRTSQESSKSSMKLDKNAGNKGYLVLGQKACKNFAKNFAKIYIIKAAWNQRRKQ